MVRLLIFPFFVYFSVIAIVSYCLNVLSRHQVGFPIVLTKFNNLTLSFSGAYNEILLAILMLC